MMENKEAIIKEAEEIVLHTYNRYQVVLDHGDGVYLYDTDGKKYLDFAAGIAAVRPHGGGPGRPFGQCEAVFGEEVQRFPHVSVYFGAFHSSV